MRIAFLTQYYLPETGPAQNRLADLAKRFASWGHQVEVLTALPSYPRNHVLPEYVGRENTWETLDGVRLLRLGLYVPKTKNMKSRMANYLSFAGNALLKGPLELQRCELLLMESPPLFLAMAGVPLARLLGAGLWTNISDLWPQSAVALNMIGPGPALAMAERLESWMYRNSVLITGQTEGIVEDIQSRFPDKRVALFPNGIDTKAFDRAFDREGVRRQMGWPDDLFVVGYAGLMGEMQALDQVLNAALLLRDLPEVCFAFFGDGPRRLHLEERVRTERIKNVTFFSHQPRERMPDLQVAMDAGLVPLSRAKLFEGARPAKMFEIMAVGRPVLLCGRGEAQRVLEATPGGPAGLISAPEDPQELARQIRHLAGDRRLALEMGARGRAYVFASFDREPIARRIEELATSVLGSRAT